ncbi:MAG: DUF5317 family protein [Bacillota bacterium]
MKEEIYKKKHDLLIYIIFFLILILIGVFCNMSAVLSNNGRMPVQSGNNNYQTDKHFGFTHPEEVNKYPLADIFYFSLNEMYYSIGDVMIISSFIIMIFILSYYVNIDIKYRYYKKWKKKNKF